MEALLLDYTDPALEQTLEDAGLHLYRAYEVDVEDFAPEFYEAEVLVVRSRFPINAQFLNKMTSLKVIGRLGAGLENIDLDHAHSRGITTLRVPEGNAQAVAEHALGMLLYLINHFGRAQRELRQGQWIREANKGRELFSLTVGIIGFGVMGKRFAETLAVLGARVLVHDKYKSGFGTSQIHEVSLETLKGEADVISLHMSLSNETRGYFDEAFIGSVQKPFYFINTARGQMAPLDSVLSGLESGKILGAGLDVLEVEKSSFTGLDTAHLPHAYKVLSTMDNVIITPHIAGWTHDAFTKMGKGLAQKILAALDANA